jgi:DNA-binding transcriptional regulator WhiA
LGGYEIKTRSHKQSMNTENIKNELREQKLRRPTKKFNPLSTEKAYILGVLCGDGSISSKSIRFEIKKDEEFIQEFSNCLKEVYGLEYKYSYYTKRNSYVLYASTEIICQDLLRYGNFKTFEWTIPKEIINSKKKKIKSMFLRGIFDSEGSSSRYCVSMSSANEFGIGQVSKLLDSLNIQNKIMKTKRGYYILYITKRERLIKFREDVGFTIKRKMEPLKSLQ